MFVVSCVAKCGVIYTNLFKKSYIMAFKPIRGLLFVKLKQISERWLGVGVFIRHSKLYAVFKAQYFVSVNGVLGFVVNRGVVSRIGRGLINYISEMLFGWLIEVNVRGNIYLWRRWFLSKFRRNALMMRCGYFYNLLILLPKNIRLFWYKSYARFFSTSLLILCTVIEYVRFVRNLFPYKLVGFIFEEERFNLKLGKRAKKK